MKMTLCDLIWVGIKKVLTFQEPERKRKVIVSQRGVAVQCSPMYGLAIG